MILSDLQPLFFQPEAGSAPAFMQEWLAQSNVYGTRDPLPLQIIIPADDLGQVYATALPEDGGEEVSIELDWQQVGASDYYVGMPASPTAMLPLAGGTWRIAATDDNNGTEVVSEPFFVCTEHDPEQMELVYSNSSNVTAYNAVFVLNQSPITFKWRFPGGLKPQGFAPLLDGEDFRNQRQEVVQLYGTGYGKHTLTLGDAEGVPYYYADLLNKVLTLDNVQMRRRHADGTWDIWTLRRSGNAVPQLAETFAGSGLFFVTQEIEIITNQLEL